MPGMEPPRPDDPSKPTQPAFDALAAGSRATQNYSVGRPQVEKVRYTHDAMIDLLIQNPGISQGSLANYFGYSQSWVCSIMASDAFQVQLAQRRHELIDPAIALSIEERFNALATASVEKLIEHINRPAVEVDPEILIKAATLGAKALGIGGNAPPKTVIINSDDRLEALSSRLTGLLRRQTEGICDVEATEIKECKTLPGSASGSSA